MGKFLERHKLLKLTQEEKEYLNRPITRNRNSNCKGSGLMNATKCLKKN